jgi:hypothetical protein
MEVRDSAGNFLAYYVRMSPHASYIANGAVELMHTTADIVESAPYFGINIDEVCERTFCTPDEIANTKNFEDILEYIFNEKLKTATNFQKKMIANKTKTSIPFQIFSFRSSFTDMLVRSILHANEIEIVAKDIVTISLTENEISPLAVKKVKNINDDLINDLMNRKQKFSKWRDLFKNSIQRYHELNQVMSDIEFEIIHNEFESDLNRQITEIRKTRKTRVDIDGNAFYDNELIEIDGENIGMTPEEYDEYIIENPKKHIKQKRATLIKAKKVLKRSMKIYEKHRGSNELKSFIKGDTITINGVLFDYYVKKKSNNLISHSGKPNSFTIPYDMTMYSKEGGKLASGCLYFENTPIIDQLLALSFYVQNKEQELELIDKTNWFSRTEEFLNNEILYPSGDETDNDDGISDSCIFKPTRYEISSRKLHDYLFNHPLMNTWMATALNIDNEMLGVFDRNLLIQNYNFT